METFFSFLAKRVDDCSSCLCVGLDPHPSDLPSPTAEAARDFCLRLVEATAPFAAAFKPNAAFFELYGPQGWAALKDVIRAVQAESVRLGSMIPVILDAKRGDIASTAEAYARSAFETLGAHAITLSLYLGKDLIDPFLSYKEKGVFLLCKTSNPGAADLQDLMIDDGPRTMGEAPFSIVGRPRSVPLYEHIASLAQTWNTGDNIGLVVGATQPDALRCVRSAAPDLWLLVPGVGVQGGYLETALKTGLRADGKGILINVSRAISRSENPRLAAANLRDEMFGVLREQRQESRKTVPVSMKTSQPSGTILSYPLSTLADGLLEAGCIKFGDFTLKVWLEIPHLY